MRDNLREVEGGGAQKRHQITQGKGGGELKLK